MEFSQEQEAKSFSHSGDDVVTGISQVSTVADGIVYDLSGQKVKTLRKGTVYVVNGKKIIIK